MFGYKTYNGTNIQIFVYILIYSYILFFVLTYFTLHEF
nr:MAG TPA: hypothetical protein [Caudoviricetes sp.]